jgi:hypothetical protein
LPHLVARTGAGPWKPRLSAVLCSWGPLPRGSALVDYWRGRLGKAERLNLETLAQVYPNALTKEEAAAKAVYEASPQRGCRSLAFTYNNPVAFAEYAMGVAEDGRALDLKTVALSAGTFGYIKVEFLKGRARSSGQRSSAAWLSELSY